MQILHFSVHCISRCKIWFTLICVNCVEFCERKHFNFHFCQLLVYHLWYIQLYEFPISHRIRRHFGGCQKHPEGRVFIFGGRCGPFLLIFGWLSLNFTRICCFESRIANTGGIVHIFHPIWLNYEIYLLIFCLLGVWSILL